MARRLLFLAALALFAVPAAGREFRYGDVVVRVLPDLPQSATHGYHEFPFQVTNESSRPRRVTLAGPDTVHGGAGVHSLRSIERTVTVGPRSSLRLALLQPPLPAFGSGLRVIVDGRPQAEVIPWSSGHPEYRLGAAGLTAGGPVLHRSRRILISQGLTEQSFPPHKPEDYWLFRAVMPTSSWSGDWLAYSGFDGVVVTAGELAETPAAVAAGLRHYVEAGGSLLVLGPARPDVRPQASIDEAGLRVDYAGFGVALSAPVAQVTDLDGRQLARVEDAWRRSRKVWDRTRNPSGTHRMFAVTGGVEIPVRGLFLMVVAFTVLVGPVNLAVLKRRDKRMWLLFTVPAASLATCALVVLYVLLGEGVVRLARTEGLTVLDERARRATTLGWTGFYASLTPSGGLRFDAGTEVSPVVSWDRGQRDGGGRTVEWSADQRLGRGWLRARLPAYFVLRKSEQRRERIRLRRRDGGALEAVNGLGVDLESLSVADGDGRVYETRGLAAGAAATLEPTEEVAAGGPKVLRELYRGDLPSRMLRLEQEPQRYLRRRTWIAVARASPFLETGLDGLDHVREKAVIYGISGDDGT